MKTICIDFDGVIHKYSKGWQDGEIYDEAINSSIRSINDLMSQGYSVIIFSTRSPRQIKRWLKQQSNPLLYMSQADFMDYYYPFTTDDPILINKEYTNLDKLQYKLKIIPFWKKFWNSNCIGITRRKLPAFIYVDDRALKFEGDWNETVKQINTFKTYQE
jgi:hypothetical protein